MGYEAIYMKKISTIIGVKIKASDGNGNYCEKNNDKLGMEIKKGTTSRSKTKQNCERKSKWKWNMESGWKYKWGWWWKCKC